MDSTVTSRRGAGVVRVLIVSRALRGEDRSDGIANFIRGFVSNLPDDFQVEVCGVGDDTSPGKEWQTRVLAGREIPYLPVARWPRNAPGFAKARAILGMLLTRGRLMTHGRVLQVHFSGFDLGLVGHHAPIIRVVHPDLSARRSLRSSIGVSLIERIAIRRASKVYFVNRATYEIYAKRGGPGAHRMVSLPLFVDTALFHALSPAERQLTRTALAADLGLRSDLPWILFAGRLVSRKRPLLALNALAAAPAGSVLEAAQLVFVGDGDLRAQLERAARDSGIPEKVRFLGNLPQDRLAGLMQSADTFLLTSEWEGGPTVAYEALAAGLPIVSTPVGDVPRLVAQSSTGWVVEWGPDEAVATELAAGLEWALGQDRAAIADRCELSVERFHAKRVLAPFYDDHRALASQA